MIIKGCSLQLEAKERSDSTCRGRIFICLSLYEVVELHRWRNCGSKSLLILEEEFL